MKNQPAHPVVWSEKGYGELDQHYTEFGFTKREAAAIQMAAALLSNVGLEYGQDEKKLIVESAIEIADAVLEKLES